MIRFKKIKITSDNKIHLDYEKMNKNGDWDEHSFKSSQRAVPSFYHAMDDLAPCVEMICEMPAGDYQAHSYEMRGLSFSYSGENEIMGVTMTALRTLTDSNSPMVLNTPHKIEESHSGYDEDLAVMSSDCLIAIKTLQREAEEYLNGKRAQINLFEGSETESEVTA